MKDFLKIVLLRSLKNLYYSLNGRKLISSKNEPIVAVNPGFSLKLNTDEAFKKAVLGPYLKFEEDLQKVREISVNPVLFSQMGSADTKLFLHYGVEKRDPSRDKRIIEFCMSLPLDQFVNKGMERSLIRRSMSGILPDKVRLNFDVRGRQGADWIQRLIPYWGDISEEIKELTEQENLSKYIDVDTIKKYHKDLGHYPNNEDNQFVHMLFNILIFQRLLNDF